MDNFWGGVTDGEISDLINNDFTVGGFMTQSEARRNYSSRLDYALKNHDLIVKGNSDIARAFYNTYLIMNNESPVRSIDYLFINLYRFTLGEKNEIYLLKGGEILVAEELKKGRIFLNKFLEYIEDKFHYE